MPVSSPLFFSPKSLPMTQPSESLPVIKRSQPIAEFEGGARVKITEIKGDEQLCHRLLSMGIFPGREVHILRKQGTSLMLRHGHMCLGVRLAPSFVIEAEAIS